jgi:hypothetical protein
VRAQTLDPQAVSYRHSSFPVADALTAAHSRFWRRLAGPGAWWTGPERVAIASEVRNARECDLCRRRKQSLSPYFVNGAHDRASDLPEIAVDAVHRLVTDASRLKREWLDQAVAAGLNVESYVELLGTVVALVSIDSFCLALGLPEHPLPAPLPGEPSRYRPASARLEEAWVPLVPEDNSGTPEADLWPAGRIGWVIRAMSLAPDEVRTLLDLSAVHYLEMQDVPNPGASRGHLTRPQIELVAGRVSALNSCFY